MLRFYASSLLLVLSTAAFASPMVEVKNVTFGQGCEKPTTKVAKAPAMCEMANAKTRIWCPDGKVFDRDEMPNPAVSRSICNLSQVP